MRRVFGKKKETAPAPTLDQASAGLGGRIGSMDDKIAALDLELRGYKDKIKKTNSVAAKKQLQKRAMEVLKRKRMYENQRDATAGQQFNIDQTSFGLESAKASIETVAAMKAASKQLKQAIRKDLDIDDVDNLADDMAELMDDFNGTIYLLVSGLARLFVFLSSIDSYIHRALLSCFVPDINEALGRNFSTPDDLDEADLDAELEMLGDELEDDLVADNDTATPSYLLPATPNVVPGKANSQVDQYGLPSAPIGNP
jgi:charged multivesicular body protein 5